MKAIDQGSIRQQNISRMWELFVSHPFITRQELADGSGLSLMTVTNLVDHLNRYGVLDFAAPREESATGRKSAGRKADHISLSNTRHMWLVLDLTDEHFRFSALTLTLSSLPSGAPWQYDTMADYAANLRSFLRMVRRHLDTALQGFDVLGVAIVTPGPYDVRFDTVINKRVPALNTLHIKQLVREELGPYEYYVDEDVKFAVRAYLPQAALLGSDVLYYVYIGEGVGGAIIHDGNVLRGLNAAAGDIGQLITRDGSSYETKLSLRAFAQMLNITANQNVSEDALLTYINALAESAPERYIQALHMAADTLAHMLHTAQWLLDPAQVIIDCRYALPFEADFIARTQDALATLLAGSLKKQPLITPAAQDMRSVIYGAAQVLSRGWIQRIVT